MKPLALSDEQMTAILHAAAPLPVADRDTFLQAIADALRDQPVLGDGLVGRTVREVLERFLRPVFERMQVQPRTKFR